MNINYLEAIKAIGLSITQEEFQTFHDNKQLIFPVPKEAQGKIVPKGVEFMVIQVEKR